jgi:hypothetical protein
VHFLGLDYGAPYGHAVAYNAWSGVGSDLGEVTLLAAAGTWWRHANCEVDRCWRLGRHKTNAGRKVCRKHHPDDGLTAGQVVEEHHRARRR